MYSREDEVGCWHECGKQSTVEGGVVKLWRGTARKHHAPRGRGHRNTGRNQNDGVRRETERDSCLGVVLNGFVARKMLDTKADPFGCNPWTQ
jgi:hypothetical protein